MVLIQSLSLVTRVYTPGLLRRAQPSPQLTMPDWNHFPLSSKHTKGPPESPWGTEREEQKRQTDRGRDGERDREGEGDGETERERQRGRERQRETERETERERERERDREREQRETKQTV